VDGRRRVAPGAEGYNDMMPPKKPTPLYRNVCVMCLFLAMVWVSDVLLSAAP
jgi:hypothetical protein